MLKMPRRRLFTLLVASAFAATGCGTKHVVSAAPPSVSAPPPADTAPMPQPTPPPPVEITPDEPPPEAPLPATPPLPAKRPAPRPRPAQPETADPVPPKPAPPQISPQLSARDLAAAKSNTNSNMQTAEKNVQLANGRQLAAAQKDLVEKINGFLGQAREAIAADDYVRAQNLAEKARVLSTELVKSF
jgi:outer membrane biosynthesis protein TonB